MKHVKFIIFAVLAMAITACSSTREVSQADVLKHNIAVEQLNSRQFLVKGSRLMLDKHNFPAVSSSTNFVMVDGDNATVQVSPGFSGGPNGVGGFTVKGSVSGFEVKERSNGAVSVKFNVQAAKGSCQVFINLNKDTSDANVVINNTFRGKNATLYGPVAHIDNSVYVGQTRP